VGARPAFDDDCKVCVGKTCVKTDVEMDINSSVGLGVSAGAQEAKIMAVSKTKKMLLVLIYFAVQGTAQRLALVATENENNKEHTNDKTDHKYPANPSPEGGQLYALSGVSLDALETYNVISSATTYISTTPHFNRFSTGQALSNRCFHDYLSADVSA